MKIKDATPEQHMEIMEFTLERLKYLPEEHKADIQAKLREVLGDDYDKQP